MKDKISVPKANMSEKAFAMDDEKALENTMEFFGRCSNADQQSRDAGKNVSTLNLANVM